MQIAAGHNVTLTRNQLVAASVALVLMVGIAGGMLFATRADLTDLLGCAGKFAAGKYPADDSGPASALGLSHQAFGVKASTSLLV